MHDLLIALAFVGMVIAPAIVAADSTTEEANSPADSATTHTESPLRP